MHAQQGLAQRFPAIEVIPSNYPPAKHKVVLAKVLGYVQWAVIGSAIFAERLLPALGYDLSPEMLQAIKDKRFGTILGAWFIGNMAVNSCTSTGAFEVFYDGQLVYSKLQTGQLPTMQELFAGIEGLMQSAQQAAAASQ